MCLLPTKANGQRRNDKDKTHKRSRPERTWSSFSKFPLISFENAEFFSSLLGAVYDSTRFWPDSDPMLDQILVGNESFQIIGVVADVHDDLLNRKPRYVQKLQSRRLPVVITKEPTQK